MQSTQSTTVRAVDVIVGSKVWSIGVLGKAGSHEYDEGCHNRSEICHHGVTSIKTPRAIIKVVRNGGKASHDEVGVIRGGGGASDAKQMADRQSDKIGAASNKRESGQPASVRAVTSISRLPSLGR
jgi:hypothetical protein